MNVISHLLLKNRFRILFFRTECDEIVTRLKGLKSDFLTSQVQRFSCDNISKEFEMDFVVPARAEEFGILFELMDSFRVEILDADNNIVKTGNYKVEKYLSSVIELDYSSSDVLLLKVKGIFKQEL